MDGAYQKMHRRFVKEKCVWFLLEDNYMIMQLILWVLGGKKAVEEHAAVWVPDGDASVCMHCSKTQFTLINRRVCQKNIKIQILFSAISIFLLLLMFLLSGLFLAWRTIIQCFLKMFFTTQDKTSPIAKLSRKQDFYLITVLLKANFELFFNSSITVVNAGLLCVDLAQTNDFYYQVKAPNLYVSVYIVIIL